MKKFQKLLFTFLILVSIPVSLILLNQKTNFLGKAFGTKADIVIDAGNVVGGKSETWRYLAQGGEERGRQLLPVIDMTKALQPKYIRIDHIFDYYNVVSKDGSGKLNFNWTELDFIIGDIRKTGAKPFISLSYMPPSISKGGDTVDVPANWADWEVLVKTTIEHISGKSNLAISDVYYEVWNEPDLFGGYKITGEKSYLDLYIHSARGAREAGNVNSFKLGGPATTGFYENWMNKLIIFCKENNVKLDFISWHRYSLNLDDYEQDFEGTSNYQGLETVISELGPNSENSDVNDNYFGAIHTIATAITLEGKVDKLFNFEIKDGPGPTKNWGRWGILTHEKFGTPEIKPRYRAIQFLNNLNGGQNLSVSGNGSWVKVIAKEKNGKTVFLIVNYDNHGKHREAVPVKVINLKSNEFNLKRIDFSGKVSEQKIKSETNSYDVLLTFEPNTASIFEISY